jgi:hypothetical protein
LFAFDLPFKDHFFCCLNIDASVEQEVGMQALAMPHRKIEREDEADTMMVL